MTPSPPMACGGWSLSTLPSSSCLHSVFSSRKPGATGARSARSAHFWWPSLRKMYGFPLTIYLLSGWLQTTFPNVDWWSHDAGHLLEMMFGWRASPHFGPFHILSFVLIGGGFLLIAAGWRVLYAAQRERRLATEGPYSYVRHPQYVGFVVVMLGFLLQWPTLLTLAMFPILVAMYVRLSFVEEREARKEFGEAYERYAAGVPAFFPNWGRLVGLPNGRKTSR